MRKRRPRVRSGKISSCLTSGLFGLRTGKYQGGRLKALGTGSLRVVCVPSLHGDPVQWVRPKRDAPAPTSTSDANRNGARRRRLGSDAKINIPDPVQWAALFGKVPSSTVGIPGVQRHTELLTGTGDTHRTSSTQTTTAQTQNRTPTHSDVPPGHRPQTTHTRTQGQERVRPERDGGPEARKDGRSEHTPHCYCPGRTWGSLTFYTKRTPVLRDG